MCMCSDIITLYHRLNSILNKYNILSYYIQILYLLFIHPRQELQCVHSDEFCVKSY